MFFLYPPDRLDEEERIRLYDEERKRRMTPGKRRVREAERQDIERERKERSRQRRNSYHHSTRPARVNTDMSEADRVRTKAWLAYGEPRPGSKVKALCGRYTSDVRCACNICIGYY
jgi:hypothetical protein